MNVIKSTLYATIFACLAFSVINTPIIMRALIYYRMYPVAEYAIEKHGAAHRAVVDGVLNEEECAALVGVIRKSARVDDRFKHSALNDTFVKFSQINVQEPPYAKEIIYRTRKNVLRTVSDTLGLGDDTYIEYGDLTKRIPSPGIKLFAGHQMHSDNCMLRMENPFGMFIPHLPTWLWDIMGMKPIDSYTCRYTPLSCCAYRTHTAVLYLNGESNNEDDRLPQMSQGEFFFLDRNDISKNVTEAVNRDIPCDACALRNMVRVKPRCGRLVMISSDTKNVHGTLPVTRGERFAMPFWFTSVAHLPGGNGGKWIRKSFHEILGKCEGHSDFYHLDERRGCVEALLESMEGHWPEQAMILKKKHRGRLRVLGF